MPDKQRSQVKPGRRGQALVLACLSLLLLALMMLLSFNLSYALRQKTQLQQHSDAMAYSMAVLEARALNYFASSNRSIAASYVTMNNAHGYMAAASVTAAMMTAGQKSFAQIAVTEGLKCIACRCSCCGHAIEAGKIAKKFGDAADKYEGKIKNQEGAFTKLVTDLDKMMDIIHKSQKSVFDSTAEALGDGSSHNLSRLRSINAPTSSELNSAVGSLNTGEFNCAIDGKQCSISGKPGNTANKTRAVVMAQVANASRNDWAAKRGGMGAPKYLNQQFLNELQSDIQGEGRTNVLTHDGTSKTVKDKGELDGDASTSNDGSKSAGHEHGRVHTMGWKDAIALPVGYEAEVVSASSGSSHTPSDGHQGTHTFEGTNSRDLASCGGNGNCFMAFRADSSAARDYGQPHVYSYVTQRLRAENVKDAPWQLNDSASVTLKHGDKEGKVTLAADEGAAMSKALVYYHRLGNWSEPPNMFNPFWRAKLHPFTPNEAENVLNKAGNSDAAELASTPKMPL
ncbi:pilus assembly protein TadG-related protein [Stigmatella aurantiaca]|nr:pilus assembly protein TadG-related protein [Stigmatella aurantiaca]